VFNDSLSKYGRIWKIIRGAIWGTRSPLEGCGGFELVLREKRSKMLFWTFLHKING